MADEMMDSMVRSIARAPEAQRREMIKTRLASFNDMDDEARIRGMKDMSAAASKLNDDELERIVYSRLESLAEDFDEHTRRKLIGSHMEALMSLPKEIMMKDMKAMASALGKCHDSCKMKLMRTMKEIVSNMPAEKQKAMMRMLPEELRKGM